MTQAQALAIIEQIQATLELPMLETLMHLSETQHELTHEQQRAFQIVMAGFRKLLLPA